MTMCHTAPNLTRSVLRRLGVHGESVHLKCKLSRCHIDAQRCSLPQPSAIDVHAIAEHTSATQPVHCGPADAKHFEGFRLR